MTKAHISCLKRFESSPLCFDLNEAFGLAQIVVHTEGLALFLNDQECRSWSCDALPFFHAIKWFDETHVIVWTENCGAVLISATEWKHLVVGEPDNICLSERYLFVSHGEETVMNVPNLRPDANAFEQEVIAVFDREGRFVAGLDKFLVANKFNEMLLDVNAAYIFRESIIFNA